MRISIKHWYYNNSRYGPAIPVRKPFFPLFPLFPLFPSLLFPRFCDFIYSQLLHSPSSLGFLPAIRPALGRERNQHISPHPSRHPVIKNACRNALCISTRHYCIRRSTPAVGKFCPSVEAFYVRLLLDRLKLILADSAQRTSPIIGNILELGSRNDTAIRITYGRVIYPTAYYTTILFHKSTLLFLLGTAMFLFATVSPYHFFCRHKDNSSDVFLQIDFFYDATSSAYSQPVTGSKADCVCRRSANVTSVCPYYNICAAAWK